MRPPPPNDHEDHPWFDAFINAMTIVGLIATVWICISLFSSCSNPEGGPREPQRVFTH
jgi:hypothetical protein